MGEFKSQGCENPDKYANHETTEEDQQENSNGFKQATDTHRSGWLLTIGAFRWRYIFLCSLKEHNGDRIVEYRFSEYHSIELRVDFVGVKYGENRNWVCSG